MRESTEGKTMEERREHGRTQRARIVEFILTYQAEHGYPPSRRDIAAAVGIGAPTVQVHLVQLAEQGVVHLVPGIPRSVRVIGEL